MRLLGWDTAHDIMVSPHGFSGPGRSGPGIFADGVHGDFWTVILGREIGRAQLGPLGTL